MVHYDYPHTAFDVDSEDVTCLNLNEFTIKDFLEFVGPFYKNTEMPFLGQPFLELIFFGDCEFRLLAHEDYNFISLKSKVSTLMNWLEKYPGLSAEYLPSTYLVVPPESITHENEDLQIIRDLWDMQKGFRRIDMRQHNITFRRLAPKRLTTLCQKLLEDSRLLSHLPGHVSNRLMGIYEHEAKNPKATK